MLRRLPGSSYRFHRVCSFQLIISYFVVKLHENEILQFQGVPFGCFQTIVWSLVSLCFQCKYCLILYTNTRHWILRMQKQSYLGFWSLEGKPVKFTVKHLTVRSFLEGKEFFNLKEPRKSKWTIIFLSDTKIDEIRTSVLNCYFSN